MSPSLFAEQIENVAQNVNVQQSTSIQQGVSFQGSQAQRPIRYTTVSPESLRRNQSLFRWYQRNYRRQGIHYRKSGRDLYVIVSAGERPTGGYTLVIRSVRRVQRNTAFIRARVIRPAPNMVVTQAITYPHLVIKIEDRSITRAEGVITASRGGLESRDSSEEQD